MSFVYPNIMVTAICGAYARIRVGSGVEHPFDPISIVESRNNYSHMV